MHHLVIPILLLWISSNAIVADSEIYQTIQQDLQTYNISCDSSDSCRQSRTSLDSLSYYSCHCDVSCVLSGTCCLDSYYFDVPQPTLKSTCRHTSAGPFVYMIDRCPSSDNVFEDLCREEWNGEDDVLKIVPLTSLFTGITYKNYFCFRCNELNDDYIYWTVRLQNFNLDSSTASMLSNVTNDKSDISLQYDSYERRWIALVGNESSIPVPVNLVVDIPEKIDNLVKRCNPFVISNCSKECSDEEVMEKCEAYTAIKTVWIENKYLTYRNIHCALCNDEKLEDICCERKGFSGGGAGSTSGGFSFVYLLDVNLSDGNKVGKTEKCKEDDELYDPYAKKCRKVSCAKAGYKPKSGKCVKV